MSRNIILGSLLFASLAMAGPYDGDTRPDAILLATLVVFLPLWIVTIGISAAVRKYCYMRAVSESFWFGLKLASIAIPVLWVLMITMIYANFDS